jgi:hypothetical protein
LPCGNAWAANRAGARGDFGGHRQIAVAELAVGNRGFLCGIMDAGVGGGPERRLQTTRANEARRQRQ